MLGDFLWWVAEKKLAGRCLRVSPFVQAFWPLEPEQLVRSGRANIHLMRGSGGKPMVPIANRPVALGTCHVQSCKSCKNHERHATGQTNGRIRLKLGGPITTMGDMIHWRCQRWRPLHTCERHVTRDFTLLHFAPEQPVRLGRERHHLTRRDDGKIALSIIEGSWVRFPTDVYRGRELNLRF